MVRVNVELKARDPDPGATEARCLALGAEDHGLFAQRDTYFAARHGRLKLREQDLVSPELIAYRRPDSGDAAESAYVIAPGGDPATLREALDAALGTVVVVAKFEALVGPGLNDRDGAHEKVARLRRELAIDDRALVAGGYADLLLDGAEALLVAADAAMRNAYVPYSEFRVGAAVRAPSGAIYAGANVENAAYPQGQCAESSAIGALVTAGETAITAVAVVAERADRCPPCGGCRQRLAEFAAADTPVYLGRAGGAIPAQMVTLADLLPLSFGRGELGR
jgi:homotetrameric cytidine deaminase